MLIFLLFKQHFLHDKIIKKTSYNHSINFKFYMMIPMAVRYNLERVATLYSLQESPYVHLKHADF